MGHKTGRIDPEQIPDWNGLVVFAHRKAEELSDEELRHIENNTLETKVIKELAETLYAEIKRRQIKPDIK